MTHHHEDSGAGFFAGISAMTFMLVAVVLVVLVVAAFAWTPWGGGDTGSGTLGDVEETLPGDQPGGGNGGGTAGPGSYRFEAEGMSPVLTANAFGLEKLFRSTRAVA